MLRWLPLPASSWLTIWVPRVHTTASPMPMDTSDQDLIWVGRVRRDISNPEAARGIDLLVLRRPNP